MRPKKTLAEKMAEALLAVMKGSNTDWAMQEDGDTLCIDGSLSLSEMASTALEVVNKEKWKPISTVRTNGAYVLVYTPATDELPAEIELAFWRKGGLVLKDDDHMGVNRDATLWADIEWPEVPK